MACNSAAVVVFIAVVAVHLIQCKLHIQSNPVTWFN